MRVPSSAVLALSGNVAIFGYLAQEEHTRFLTPEVLENLFFERFGSGDLMRVSLSVHSVIDEVTQSLNDLLMDIE